MDLPIIVAEKTPLHRNNLNEKATLNFKSKDIFVKDVGRLLLYPLKLLVTKMSKLC